MLNKIWFRYIKHIATKAKYLSTKNGDNIYFIIFVNLPQNHLRREHGMDTVKYCVNYLKQVLNRRFILSYLLDSFVSICSSYNVDVSNLNEPNAVRLDHIF